MLSPRSNRAHTAHSTRESKLNTRRTMRPCAVVHRTCCPDTTSASSNWTPGKEFRAPMELEYAPFGDGVVSFRTSCWADGDGDACCTGARHKASVPTFCVAAPWWCTRSDGCGTTTSSSTSSLSIGHKAKAHGRAQGMNCGHCSSVVPTAASRQQSELHRVSVDARVPRTEGQKTTPFPLRPGKRPPKHPRHGVGTGKHAPGFGCCFARGDAGDDASSQNSLFTSMS